MNATDANLAVQPGRPSRLSSETPLGRPFPRFDPAAPAIENIAKLIGAGAAARLGAMFGGERVWVPNDAGHLTRRRITLMRGRGSSVARIARVLRVSERYVYKVLAEGRNA